MVRLPAGTRKLSLLWMVQTGTWFHKVQNSVGVVGCQRWQGRDVDYCQNLEWVEANFNCLNKPLWRVDIERYLNFMRPYIPQTDLHYMILYYTQPRYICCTHTKHMLHTQKTYVAHIQNICCTHTKHMLHTYKTYVAHIKNICCTHKKHMLHT
jgi:hypothetical protein